MKSLYLATLLCCISADLFAQSTATIYANGATGSYITGNTTTSARTDNTMTVKDGSQRSYAVFNISAAGIPAGSSITSATLTFVKSAYTAGSGTITFGIFGTATNLSTVSTASTLYAGIIAGTSLSTTTWGTSTGTTTLTLNGSALTLLLANISNTGFSIGWALAGTSTTRTYTITGETGTTNGPKLTINYTPPCSGAPTPGNTITSLASVCNGLTTGLSLQSATAGTGVSYQWYSAPDVSGSPGTFTAISGANSAAYTATITSTTWYESAVACSFSSSTTNSTPVQVAVLALPSAITGSSTVCNGLSTTLNSTPSGGTWASGNTTIATINASTGVVTGVSVGSAPITYTAPDACIATSAESVTLAPSAITISPATAYSVCPGSSVSPVASGTVPPVTLLSQNFNSGPADQAASGSWTVVNTGASSSYNWAIRPSGGFPDQTSVTGDGTPFAGADADEAGTITLATALISPSFSTVGYTSATISYNEYYEYYPDDYNVEVDYSLDGGSTWNVAFSELGSSDYSYTWSAGSPNQTISLPSGAIGQPNVKLRWYYSSYFGWQWAVDNIVVTTSPVSIASSAFTWAGISGATGLSCPNCANPTITAAAAGNNVYSVSTTYAGCTATSGVNVLVNQPGTFSGNVPVCAGLSTTTLSNSRAGGTWSSSSPLIATINPATGVVTGVIGGTANIAYTLPPGCVGNTIVTVNPSPNTSGFGLASTSPCIGNAAAITVSSALLPGTYTVTYNLSGATTSSGNTATLVVGGGSGIFSTVPLGVSGSTAVTVTTVTNSSGCTSSPSSGNSVTFNVNPLPLPITGTTTVCAGFTTTLADGGGGSWSSSPTAIATVGPSTGVVTGVSGGVATITYTLPTTCAITTGYTVNQTPAITGGTGACIGNSVSLGDPSPGGVWGTSNPGIATVTGGGVATGVALGSANISYTLLSTGCSALQPFAVTSPPTVYNVTGGGYRCPTGGGLSVGLSNSDIGFSYQLYIGGVASGSPLSGVAGPINFGTFTATGIYTVKANPGTTCQTNMSGAATISLYTPPTAYAISGGGAYCTGGTGVHVYLSASSSGVSYQLYNGAVPAGAPVAGSGAVLDFGSQTANGTYTVVATDGTTGCTNTMTGSVTVTINLLPVPYAVTGGGSYCTGGAGVPVGLFNSVTGISYQLYRGGVATGAPVAGTGSAIPFGPQVITGNYTVVAVNTATGCTNNMSGSANVIAGSVPSVFTVTGGGAYCAGSGGIHIGLSGSAIGINYQLNNGSPFGAIVAGTGSSIDMGLISVVGTYSVIATSASGSCSNTMAGSGLVSISPAPATFTVTGGGSYCAGTGGNHIGLSGSVLGTNYYLFNAGVLAGGSSGTGAALDFGLVTVAGNYTVSASIAGSGCSGSMTGSVNIVINALPNAYPVTGGGSYCSGTSAPHVLLGSSDAGVNYQLLRGSTPVGGTVAGGGAIDFGAQAVAGTYTVLAANSATGCTKTMSGSVTVSVSPLPTAYTVTGGGSYCAGGTGVVIGLTGSDIGTSYQLMDGGVSVGTALSGTGSGLTFGLNAAAGNYAVIATSAATTCTRAMSGKVSVVVNPLPVAYILSGGGSYCAGGTGSHIGLSSSDLGVNYQLYNGTAASGTSSGGSGGALDLGLQTAAGTYTIIGTNAVTGCSSAMTGSEVVNISPLPLAYNVTGGGNYCPLGTGVHIGLNSTNSGVSYQLYFGGVPLSGPVAGTGSPVDFGLYTGAGAYAVTATNAVTGCAADMAGSATVGISPLPPVHTVTGGGGVDCAGGIGVHIGLNGSDLGNTYQLYRGAVLSGSSLAGTGSALDFGLETLGGSYTAVATNTGTGCNNSMSGGAVIALSGLPSAHTITGGGNYCPGGTGVAIGLDGTDAGIIYQLYNGTLAVGSPLAGTGSILGFGLQTATGAYTVRATNATTGCNTAMSGSATVGISPLPVAYSVGGGGNYCVGGAGAHVLLSGSDAGITYSLYSGGALTATSLSGTGAPLDFGLQLAGNYTLSAVSTSTACTNNMSGSAVIISEPLPAAFGVAGGGYYCAGDSGVRVSLDSSVAGVNYQLYVSGAAVGGPVAGTGTVLDFGNQVAAGSYTVVATNATTLCSSNMTGAVPVFINPVPANYTVAGGGPYCYGGAGSDITLSGSTSGITYQLHNGTALTGVPVFGTGSPLDFGMITAAGNYTITGTYPTTGCSTVMSGSSTITVLPLPTVYEVKGGGYACPGGPGADVSLSSSSTGASYQLFIGGIASGGPVSGTGSPLDFGLQATPGACTVTATSLVTGCSVAMTGSIAIIAGTAPSAYTVNSSSSSGYCAGSAGVLVYLAGSDPGVTYQLYRGATAAGAPINGTGGLLPFGDQAITGTYTISGTNTTSGCAANMPGSIAVYVNPLPPVYNVTGGGGYCSGGAGVHIGLSGSSAGMQYQLYHSGAALGAAVAGTGSALDLGLQTLSGSYTVVATNTGTSCSSNMAGTAVVYVIAAPVAYTVTGGGSFCAGGTGEHVGLSGSVTGVTYQLNLDGGISGSPVAGTGAPLDFGLNTLSGYYTVMATSTSTGCTGAMTGGVVVTPIALPLPHAVSGGGSYCAGGSGQLVGLAGSSTGVSYKLYYGSTLVGTALAGTGFGISFGLQAGGGAYTVIGVDNGTSCTSEMPGSAVITVNPLPDIFPVTGGGSYCAGGTGAGIGLGSSVSGINYTLFYGTSNAGVVAGTGTVLSFGMQVGAGSYTVEATDPGTGCSVLMTGMAVINVIPVVTPSVSVSTGSGDTLCSGVYTTFTATGTNGGSVPTYAWTVNGILTGTGMAYSYIPVDGDVVAVTYNSNAACATPSTVNQSAAVSVWAKEVPGVTISANPGVEVCNGASVTFSAAPSYGGIAPSYVWMNGSSIVGAGPTLAIIPLAGDVISCKMTSGYLCRLANSATSAPAVMIIDTPSTPVVTIAAYPGLSIAEGETLTLEATVTKGGPSPTYQWTVNSTAISGATGPEYSGSNFGNGDIIACDVLSSGGCSGIPGTGSVTIHVSNVGVQAINNNPVGLQVIPNPNNGSFAVSGTIGSEEAVQLEVTDLVGQVAYKSTVLPKHGLINERVQLNNSAANGMYILNVRWGSDNVVFHVVVER